MTKPFQLTRRGAFIAAAGAIAAPGIARAQVERITLRLDFSPWGVHAAMHRAPSVQGLPVWKRWGPHWKISAQTGQSL